MGGIKVTLIGESTVGKSSIMIRFIENKFDNTLASIGTQFGTKTIEIDNEKITFHVWDTAGQEKFRALTKQYYIDAQVIILVYDITNKKSFDEIKNYWYNEIKSNVNENAIFCLVGNKNDLYEKEEVSNFEGEEFADSINAIFKSTSALSNNGIPNLFENIGKKILELKKKGELDESICTKELLNENKKNHKCC